MLLLSNIFGQGWLYFDTFWSPSNLTLSVCHPVCLPLIFLKLLKRGIAIEELFAVQFFSGT